jgi:Tol biopolymer transport system component
MKKVFYASLGILVLVLIFLGAYNFVFRDNASDPVADPEKKEALKKENQEEKTSPATQEIVSPLNETVLGVTAGNDGALYYYSLDDGSLKKSSLEGKDKTILLSNLPGTPARLIWSPRKDKVLLFLSQTGGQSLWHFADLGSKTLVPLKPEISRVAWNNLGDKILYQFTDPLTGKRSLNIAAPDGSDWKRIADLGTRDSFIAPVPHSTLVSFWNRSNALEKTSFETVSSIGKNRHVLLTEKFGADYLWSPDGERVLVSTSDQKGGHLLTLNLMNQNGGEYQSLSIPTLVSKAVWSASGKTLYYALPGTLPENAVLPNDYYAKPLYTADTFWKIDLDSGKKTRLVDLKEVTQNFDSADLFLSPSEDALFFTERQTKRLYRIDL